MFLSYLQRTPSSRLCPLYPTLELRPGETAKEAFRVTQDSATTNANRTNSCDQRRSGIRYRERPVDGIAKLGGLPLYRNWPAGIVNRDVNKNAVRHQNLAAVFAKALDPDFHRNCDGSAPDLLHPGVTRHRVPHSDRLQK